MVGVGAGTEEDQIALLQVGVGNGGAVVEQLVGGGAIQRIAELLVYVSRKAGAVKCKGI